MNTVDSQVKMIGGVVLLVIAIFIFFMLNPFVQVNPGQRGVLIKQGKIQDTILTEGMHMRTPFVDSVEIMNVRVLKTDVDANAASSDIQAVSTKIAVNWHLDPKKVNVIYQNIGRESDVVDGIIRPAVSEVVKATTAKRTATDIIAKREGLKKDIDAILSERLLGYNIIVDDVSVVDVDFSDEFNKAVNDKTVAEQRYQESVQQTKRIQEEANQRIITASAEAEAIKIQTEALAQSSALVELKLAEALKISAEKGQPIVPKTVLGNSSNVLYNVGGTE